MKASHLYVSLALVLVVFLSSSLVDAQLDSLVVGGKTVYIQHSLVSFADACKDRGEKLAEVNSANIVALKQRLTAPVWIRSWNGDDYGGLIQLKFHPSGAITVAPEGEKNEALCVNSKGSCNYQPYQWSECTKPCGSGTRSRRFSSSPATNDCPEFEEVESCNPTPCKLNCMLIHLPSGRIIQYIPHAWEYSEACAEINEQPANLYNQDIPSLSWLPSQAWIGAYDTNAAGSLGFTPPASVNLWNPKLKLPASLCTKTRVASACNTTQVVYPGQPGFTLTGL